MSKILLGLVLSPSSQSADDKYAHIYVWNDGNDVLQVKAGADYSVTVNEKTGDSVTHGSKPKTLNLKPGDHALVGDIIEWELDSALWFDVYFKTKSESGWNWYAYNLKTNSPTKQIIPGLNQEAWIVEPQLKKKK